MSDIPSTSDPEVAIIAAAWNIAQKLRSGSTTEVFFNAMLERFLLPYKAIKLAAKKDYPQDIDVADILKRMGESK